MKVDRLETHDRYQHLTKQSFDIAECVQDLINQRPFGKYPFYIFAHARTDDDGVTKRLIWQPRLTKPKAQSNSMLFKAYPGTDNVRIIWMIPSPELWGQYKKGNVTEHDISAWSIDQFTTNKEALEASEPDDLDDEKIDAIYKELSINARYDKRMRETFPSPTSLVLPL